MKKGIYILIMTVMLSSCGWVQQKQREGVAVELKGQVLTYAQLDDVTRNASSAEDSAAMAENYIRQWAEDILEYAEAKDMASKELDALVEDYRRSLYVHEYERKLVSRHQPKQWSDSAVQRIYDEQKNQLRLKESIVKGVLLVVPQNTPQIKQAQTWLEKLNDDNIEKIEKYAYHYASGYEYFPGEWKSATQILLRLPLETDVLTEQIRKHNQIVVEDSVSVYILQVTDKCLTGDVMPIEYARDNIQQILLNRWQIEFLKKERQNLLVGAERFNQLKRYEK